MRMKFHIFRDNNRNTVFPFNWETQRLVHLIPLKNPDGSVDVVRIVEDDGLGNYVRLTDIRRGEVLSLRVD